jgi:hypothetical protein
MKPTELFIPLLALVGLAIVAPGFQHFLGYLDDAPTHIQFLAGLILPAFVILLGASWLEPRGSK